MNRREFNRVFGAGLGSTILPTPTFALAPKPKMALQLWTFRDLIQEDLFKAIDIAAYIGFVAVETTKWPEGISLEKGAKEIDKSGMEVCSAHIDLPTEQNKNQLIELADAYRTKTMIWGGWPKDPRYSSAEGVNSLVNTYNEANAFFKEKGLRFGLHTHWWELQPLPDGQLPFDLLTTLLDKEIFFELDTYWAKVAGHDPAQLVASLGDRAPFLHIKDGSAEYTPELDSNGPGSMVAVGDGTLDFPKIAEAGEGTTKWMVVELDNCETDVAEAVFDSYLYLKKNKLAKGMI